MDLEKRLIRPNIACRQPMMRVVGPPLATVGTLVGQWGAEIMLWGHSCGLAVLAIVKTVFGPPSAHLLELLRTSGQLLLPLWQVMTHAAGVGHSCCCACTSLGCVNSTKPTLFLTAASEDSRIN